MYKGIKLSEMIKLSEVIKKSEGFKTHREISLENTVDIIMKSAAWRDDSVEIHLGLGKIERKCKLVKKKREGNHQLDATCNHISPQVSEHQGHNSW